MCTEDEWGGVLLRQFLETFQQTPRCAAVFGSQRHHEEVEVVEQGYVVVAVRLCHLEQLSPAIFDRHAWHKRPKTEVLRSAKSSTRRC